MENKIICPDKIDTVTKRAKHRHELKGIIRDLRFILDELEMDEASEDEKFQMQCFCDFDTNIEKIKKGWEDYKSLLRNKQY